MPTPTEIYTQSSETIAQIVQRFAPDEKAIERNLGHVGLAVFRQEKNISFTPVHQQGPKIQIKNFFAGHPRKYRYLPKENLRRNIVEFVYTAQEFTKLEIQYLFGDYGVEIMYTMCDFMGYFKRIQDTEISERQWQRFTKTR